MWGTVPLRFSTEGGPILVVGLKPLHKYLIETDDEEVREVETDRVGTLLLSYPMDRNAGVRIYESNHGVKNGKIGTGAGSPVLSSKP